MKTLTSFQAIPNLVNNRLSCKTYPEVVWGIAIITICIAILPKQTLAQSDVPYSCHSKNTIENPVNVGCTDFTDYIPGATDPIKTIRIAFHVLQKEAPSEKDNFDENVTADVNFLNGVFNRINALFSLCNVQWCNCGYVNGLNQTRDSRIRFELDGIYYHRDNSGYVNGDGSYSNL